ncbi:2Fe-2S iron-sulfur cluster-binding protein [Mesorhizobium sp. M0814]|uniref:2Fe-2S iron-sulfur cluster-binding protein n=1 Tax=Mesorhizobium sp. M0814 TaxID=2957004 RepID=UPI00333581C4
MTSYRLSSGGLIDRQSRIEFSFDGRSFEGHAGDTLASALLANGRQLVGRALNIIARAAS